MLPATSWFLRCTCSQSLPEAKFLWRFLCFITAPKAILNKVWCFFEVISEAKDLKVWVSKWTVNLERHEHEKKIYHMHNLQLKLCKVYLVFSCLTMFLRPQPRINIRIYLNPQLFLFRVSQKVFRLPVAKLSKFDAEFAGCVWTEAVS